MSSFRFPRQDFKPKKLPSETEIQSFIQAIPELRMKTMMVLYAVTGFRRNELKHLSLKDIDLEKRMIIPQKSESMTKHVWATCFNQEAKNLLCEYLATRKDDNPRLFPVSQDTMRLILKEAYAKTRLRITPQTLREWFCQRMGELGAPDRYVDAFCGRTPKSVLARH